MKKNRFFFVWQPTFFCLNFFDGVLRWIFLGLFFFCRQTKSLKTKKTVICSTRGGVALGRQEEKAKAINNAYFFPKNFDFCFLFLVFFVRFRSKRAS